MGSNVTSLNYRHNPVAFTTGPASTAATLCYYKAGSGTVCGDDFYIEKLQ